MTPRRSRALISVYSVALAITLSACNTSQERLNRAAQVVLTRSAALTPSAGAPAATAATVAPTRGPNAGPVTATPSLIYALCLVQAAAQLRIQPDGAADSAASIQVGDIITAYGRTADAAWILGWNKNDSRGWVSASALGCTVPMAELMPTEPNALRLKPVAVVGAVEAVTPTALAPAGTSIPPTPLPKSTATQQPAAPTATPVPAMATVTTAATETPAQAATTSSESVATVAAKTATPIIIIQIVTVVVTVTAVPAEATSTPALVSTPTPVPTARAETVTPKPTLAATSTAPTTLFVLQQVRCVVTPGTPVNLRLGAARTERLLGTLREGAPFVVTGRNEGGDWLYGVTARGTLGWLIASAITCEDDAGKLPVVDR